MEEKNKFNKGSEWRKWDLHVHSPASYGFKGTWDEFEIQLKNADCDVIGINDYFSVTGYKKIQERIINGELDIGNRVIFPVVEMRMQDSLQNKNTKTNGVTHFNFHIIFSNKLDIEDIESFIKSLKSGDSIIGADYRDKSKLKDKKISFKETLNLLNNDKKFTGKFLVWLPYDEYGGIDEIDPNSDGWIKEKFIKDSHILGSSNRKQIDFFLWKSPLKKDGKPKFSEQQFKEWLGNKKACIKGSDSHSASYPIGKLKDKKSNPIEKFCWIKADPTFEGLKQVIIEPEDRIFIGEKPKIFERIKNNKTKYISELHIDKINEYKGQNGVWFNNINIKLNQELVAIIGNKGSGKSALSDILALCGEYKEHDNFSFLRNKKFRKKGYAENFEASLKWLDGNTIPKKLNDAPREEEPRVKYLPQGDFENLTNEIEKAENFQKEIESVIFSHLEQSEKLGFSNFQDLLSHHNKVIEEAITHIKNDIFILNDEILKLEKKLHPNYIKNIESKIKQKEDELKALEEPQKVEDPNKNPEISEKSKKINQKILGLKQKIEEYEEQIKEQEKTKNIITEELSELSNLKQSLELKENELKEFKKSKKIELERYNLNIDDIIKVEIKTDKIEKLINDKKQKIKYVENLLNGTDEKEGLYNLKKKKEEELNKEKNKLDEPQKKYQRYLEEYKSWQNQKSLIEGDEKIPDTLNYYKKQREYIKNQLKDDIEKLKQNRLDKISKIYDKKQEIKSLYENIKKGISKKIEENKELLKGYDIKIDTSLILNNNFVEVFCDFIDKSKRGTFNTKEGCEVEIKKIIDGKNFNNFGDIKTILEDIESYLWEDKRENIKLDERKRHIEDQVKDVKRFYDYLFSLDYIKLNYELKLGSKSLEQLSPGERGALLLIFYLLLDSNDIPLILDQPEDNLDNHTVANVLVPFIKRAKKQRQIILVTHNPNLAVVADAEQIIWVNIDKENKNTFEFSSGSIENKNINEKIINVLEGTIPAFNKRKNKYYI